MEDALKRTIFVLMSLLVLFASLPAFADDGEFAPPAITEEERLLLEAKAKTKPFPIGARVSLAQSVGGGTFTTDENVRRSAYDISLNLAPYWRITPLMRLGARLSLSHAVVENYESVATYKNRTLFSDLSFSLSHGRLYKIPKLGIGINGALSISLPTSLQSQFRGLYCMVNGKLGLSRMLGPVYVGYAFNFYKNFNKYTTPIIDKSEAGDYVVLSHFKGNEQLTTDLVSVGGNNVSHGIVNSFLVSWNITGKIALALYYSINNGWTYAAYDNDELSSEYAVGGRGQRDVSTGVVDLSYQVNNNLAVSLGTQTLTSPKTANNKSWVWPFMNFSQEHRQNTVVYLSFDGVF